MRDTAADTLIGRPEETVAKPIPRRPARPGVAGAAGRRAPGHELTCDIQGSLSPFGEVEFPLESVPYVHPVTEMNR